jgi:hypothetical protein
MSGGALSDPDVIEALRSIDQRRRRCGLPCPRCMQAPISDHSKHGFCQPCTTAQDERIKASKRRSYHRGKANGDDPADAGEGTPGELNRVQLW